MTPEKIAQWIDDLKTLRRNPLRVMSHTDLLSILTELTALREQVASAKAMESGK